MISTPAWTGSGGWLTSPGRSRAPTRLWISTTGNVLNKQNMVSTANSELYHVNGASNGYDNLNRLTDFRRGTLSDTNSDGAPDTVTTSSTTVNWNLDATGNWSNSIDNGIALSKNAHWLFDQGLWSLNDDFHVIVNHPRFAEAADSFPLLGTYHGRKLRLPSSAQHWPNAVHVAWHRREHSLCYA